MKYTNEHVQAAIRLAERLAQAESCKKTFTEAAKEQSGYEHLVDMSIDSIGQCHEQLLTAEDQLAEKLLPQARIVVEMESKRRMALLETPFGELLNAVSHQRTIEAEGEGWGDNSAPFKFFLNNQEWAMFLTALNESNKGDALEALTAILVNIQEDLVEIHLPPAPPDYQMPE